MKKKMKEL